MNFQKLALSFMYQDQKVQLQGVRETTKIMDANGLDKMTHNSGHLFMIRVLPAESLTEEESDDIHLEIVTLTKKFHILFGHPQQLPPSRATFDHRILLQKGSNPVNTRPYRYSSRQKT